MNWLFFYRREKFSRDSVLNFVLWAVWDSQYVTFFMLSNYPALLLLVGKSCLSMYKAIKWKYHQQFVQILRQNDGAQTQTPFGTFLTLLKMEEHSVLLFLVRAIPFEKMSQTKNCFQVIPLKRNTFCCILAEFGCLLKYYWEKQSLPWPLVHV